MSPRCDASHPERNVRCAEPAGHDGDHQGRPDPRTQGRVKWSPDDPRLSGGPE